MECYRVAVWHDDGEHEPFESFSHGIFLTKDKLCEFIAKEYENKTFEAEFYGGAGNLTWNLIERTTGKDSNLVILCQIEELHQ